MDNELNNQNHQPTSNGSEETPQLIPTLAPVPPAAPVPTPTPALEPVQPTTQEQIPEPTQQQTTPPVQAQPEAPIVAPEEPKKNPIKTVGIVVAVIVGLIIVVKLFGGSGSSGGSSSKLDEASFGDTISSKYGVKYKVSSAKKVEDSYYKKHGSELIYFESELDILEYNSNAKLSFTAISSNKATGSCTINTKSVSNYDAGEAIHAGNTYQSGNKYYIACLQSKESENPLQDVVGYAATICDSNYETCENIAIY